MKDIGRLSFLIVLGTKDRVTSSGSSRIDITFYTVKRICVLKRDLYLLY